MCWPSGCPGHCATLFYRVVGCMPTCTQDQGCQHGGGLLDFPRRVLWLNVLGVFHCSAPGTSWCSLAFVILAQRTVVAPQTRFIDRVVYMRVFCSSCLHGFDARFRERLRRIWLHHRSQEVLLLSPCPKHDVRRAHASVYGFGGTLHVFPT